MKPISRSAGVLLLIVLSSLLPTGRGMAASWKTNNSMAVARQFHAATLLTNGLVLVAGGEDATFQATATSELFIPTTGTWTNTGVLNDSRVLFTVTVLNNGLVLVAGGFNSGGNLATAELYNPSTGLWSLTGSMTNARCAHTATLLANGHVLVAGGENGAGLAEAEIYNPTQGSWSQAASMSTVRGYHSATLLTNGLVLVAGGRNATGSVVEGAELYDTSTDSWTSTGALHYPRRSHTATLLSSKGNVLVVGGNEGLGAEIYNPLSGVWTLELIGGITNSFYGHSSTLLPNGSVLVASGIDWASTISFDPTTNAWIYNPRADSWTATASLNEGRYVHKATALTDGSVLVAGGGSFVSPFRLASSEIFMPVDPIILNTATLTNGHFLLAFTNTPGFGFTVLASTSASLPVTNWTELGGVTEVSSGQFQFTDAQTTTNLMRFYRVRAN